MPETGRVIPDDVWGILCIFAEARGEPYDGMVAVGNVIRTRTAKHFFSDGTVASTVTWPFQFSWMNHNDAQRGRVLGSKWDDPKMPECAKAWFESEHHSVVGDSTHYYNDVVASPIWAKANRMTYIARVGRHVFFREDRVVPKPETLEA